MYVDKLLRTDPTQASASPAAPAVQGTLTSPAPNREDCRAAAGRAGRRDSLRAGRPAGEPHGNHAQFCSRACARDGVVADADRAYLAKVVAARTGLSQADAEQRVNQVITEAKTAADAARKSAAAFSLRLVVAMLAGALSASLAAIEGGYLRNREWYLTNSNRARVVAPAE